jgi:D-galactarolactone cycloisomerase
MKIRSISAVGLRGATPAGGWSNELGPDDTIHTLVTVSTDGGLTGYGSVFADSALVRPAITALQPLWEGEDAREPERVSEKLHQHTFWQGRGGTMTHAISGIDIALWDILGQVTGQPIGRLLGGRYRDRVQPYASVLMVDPSRMADSLEPSLAAGFKSFKIGWGTFGRQDAATDEAIVAAARTAIGADAELMVDAGGSDAFWRGDLKWALRTSKMLAAYDVRWFEEPLQPDALHDYATLRQVSPVPIAGGEVLTRRQSFTPLISQHCVDIVQPDVTKVGGVSEQRRIAHLAEDFGVQFIPHGWNTAVGLAVDLHFASAISATDRIEYMTGSPYVDDLVAQPWRLDDDGMLAIPDKPGLGIALDLEHVARYADSEAWSPKSRLSAERG